jgi:hypothetical protein
MLEARGRGVECGRVRVAGGVLDDKPGRLVCGRALDATCPVRLLSRPSGVFVKRADGN